MDGQLQERLGVEAAAAGDDAPGERPVADAAAVRVARADHEISTTLGGRDEIGQPAGVVREVAVHLADVGVVALECPAEAGEVGTAEALLGGAVQHVHPVVLGGQPIGDLAGAVGRPVVDHQDVAGDRRALAGDRDGLDHPLEVLTLVVRRQADDESLGGGGTHPLGS